MILERIIPCNLKPKEYVFADMPDSIAVVECDYAHFMFGFKVVSSDVINDGKHIHVKIEIVNEYAKSLMESECVSVSFKIYKDSYKACYYGVFSVHIFKQPNPIVEAVL